MRPEECRRVFEVQIYNIENKQITAHHFNPAVILEEGQHIIVSMKSIGIYKRKGNKFTPITILVDITMDESSIIHSLEYGYLQ